ncbi:hypothetical protein chiPu_0033995, partial [Chiloscyllium punctatum]|nr:hypothetical protein [Chiloscyllium punctatum]
VAAARGGALQSDLDRHIEDEGQIGLEIADRHALHRVDQFGRHLPELALIGARRIEEAVAQHPDALVERRQDHRADVVVARRGKQQRLGLGPEQLAHSGQHEVTDDLRARRAAGLAGHDHAQLGGVEPLSELADLGRFARTFAAFKGDEATAQARPLDCCFRHVRVS